MPLTKRIDGIEEADLQALVENEEPEDKDLDYKLELHVNTIGEKKEFLADVASFANTSGGFIIYGMDEENGVAVDLRGLDIPNPDSQIATLENIIRDGIEPRIHGTRMRAITLTSLRVAIIIQIPRSWARPHKINRASRFYARNSNGKYSLDVGELRAAFTLSEAFAERVRNFRAERMAMIMVGEGPTQLPPGAQLMLHIVPFTAFDPSTQIGFESCASFDLSWPRPIVNEVLSFRHNFDGLLIISETGSYVQLFRSGIIEVVDTILLGSEKKIHLAWENPILHRMPSYVSFLKERAIDPPLFVLLTLIGVRGLTIEIDPLVCQYPHNPGHPIDRDAILVPEVLLEDYDEQPAHYMRPIFDTVWNSCGFPRSLNYDKMGERR